MRLHFQLKIGLKKMYVLFHLIEKEKYKAMGKSLVGVWWDWCVRTFSWWIYRIPDVFPEEPPYWDMMVIKHVKLPQTLIPLLHMYPLESRKAIVDKHIPERLFSTDNISWIVKCVHKLLWKSDGANYYRRQCQAHSILLELRGLALDDRQQWTDETANAGLPPEYIPAMMLFHDDKCAIEVHEYKSQLCKVQRNMYYFVDEEYQLPYEMWYDWKTFRFEYQTHHEGIIRKENESEEEYNNRVKYACVRSLSRHELIQVAMKYVVAFKCRDIFCEERLLPSRPWEKPEHFQRAAELRAFVEKRTCTEDSEPRLRQYIYDLHATELSDDDKDDDFKVAETQAVGFSNLALLPDYIEAKKEQYNLALTTIGANAHRIEEKKKAIKHTFTYGIQFRHLLPVPTKCKNIPNLFFLPWCEVLEKLHEENPLFISGTSESMLDEFFDS